MEDTVFWSWQDDCPTSTNRDFIRECLADAVNQVSETFVTAGTECIKFVYDTKGDRGMVDISQSIREKIRACAVMVADVTPVASTEGGNTNERMS